MHGQENHESASECISLEIFKNKKLTGFWEESFIELKITNKGWIIYKKDKFKNTKKFHDKGRYAIFANRMGGGKDYIVLKLFYEKSDISEDSPAIKMLVSPEKRCMWSKRLNIKVCVE